MDFGTNKLESNGENTSNPSRDLQSHIEFQSMHKKDSKISRNKDKVS